VAVDLYYEIKELKRRLDSIVLVGTISKVDLDLARVRVEIGDIVTGFLPWLTQRAGGDVSWWSPEVGEQVMVFSPSGELSLGVVLPAIYQQSFPASSNSPDIKKITFKDGAVIEYDRASHHLKAALPAGATTELVSDGGVSVIGDVSVTGNIVASGDITDAVRSMADDRGIYNGHKHGGVVAGPPTVFALPTLESQ